MAADKRSESRRRPRPPKGRVADADIEQARYQVARAFSLLGAVGTGGRPRCPACGTDKKGKVSAKDNKGYWKCFKCGTYGSPIKLLTEYGGYSFPDAVSALLGRPVSTEARKRMPTKLIEVTPDEGFTAEIDPEVYNWIARQGDRDAAAQFYAQWHIDPQYVAEAGCFYLPLKRLELKKLQALAVETFGRERLLACGVAMERDPKYVRPARNEIDRLIGDLNFPGMPAGYPVGEPHVMPDARISYMQFRADGKTRDKVVAHKRWKSARDAAKAAGQPIPDKAEYQAPFLSLRGAPHRAQIGGGVWRLARLEAGSTVIVVEGIKDLLAARTMGANAYAIAGTEALPPPEVCRLLAPHNVLVALDGDEAGESAKQKVIDHLRDNGVTNVGPKDMPAGMDVTDILVDRHARAGCNCPTCVQWRDDRGITPDEQARAS